MANISKRAKTQIVTAVQHTSTQDNGNNVSVDASTSGVNTGKVATNNSSPESEPKPVTEANLAKHAQAHEETPSTVDRESATMKSSNNSNLVPNMQSWLNESDDRLRWFLGGTR